MFFETPAGKCTISSKLTYQGSDKCNLLGFRSYHGKQARVR